MWVLEHCPASEEWSKRFDTEAEALAELQKHICVSCVTGVIHTSDGETEWLCKPVDPTNPRSLLATPCGCEYELREEP